MFASLTRVGIVIGVVNGVCLSLPCFGDVFTGTQTITGTVNGVPVSASGVNTGDTSTGIVQGQFQGFAPTQFAWLIEINSLISWKCRQTAQASAGVLNLQSLTGGNFSVTSHITWNDFPGMMLELTHQVSTVGFISTTTTTLLGNAPTFDPSLPIQIGDYSENWSQTLPTNIHALSIGRTFTIGGVTHEYNWDTDITYSGAVQLPGDEIRFSRGVTVEANPNAGTLSFTSTNFVVPSPGAVTVLVGAGLFALSPRRRQPQ
jgi:hypothetical protein